MSAVAITYLARSDLEDIGGRMLRYGSPVTHYWSDDWSLEFYRLQAMAGFITTSVEHDELGTVLLPELQSSYAVLDWKNLHVSRSMKRWMRSGKCVDRDYSLRVGHDLSQILAGIERAYGDEWLNRSYAELLQRLSASDAGSTQFEVMTAGLVAGREERLVAGEVGYRVGKVYTSLSGFFDRRDPSSSNAGKLQLALLADYLMNHGFAFWNLGHPKMQYKTDLGARVVSRGPFLRRWFTESGVGWSLS